MLKQYVVLSKKPKMSTGKMCSQCVHASFMALERHRSNPRGNDSITFIKDWKENGQCVIVCEVKDATILLGLDKYCKDWNIPAFLYVDEGYTEVECGTPTAFATGIIDEQHQWMFDKLKLWCDKK